MTLGSHSAPGPAAGFAYQFERALYWLAKSPAGFVVGIETDDDVAVRGSDGSLTLEQDKHSIREHAEPFGDRSRDLWNTLATWLDALETGSIALGTSRFQMVTNKVVPSCLAREIADATSEQHAQHCLAALERVGNSPPLNIHPLVERVLRPQSRETLEQLILRCELTDGTQGSAGPALRKEIVGSLQLPGWCEPIAESITDELLGWLHTTALSAWRQGGPAWIQRAHFVNQLHAIIERRRRHTSRERAEHMITVTKDAIGQAKARPFVQQLHLVTDDDTVVDGSIREFVMCSIEKARLSAQGDVTDEDWTEFAAALVSRWEKIRARILRLKKDAEEPDIGFEILMETAEDHRERLAGVETEHVYLTSGTYHRLADTIDLGWHPRFKELMQTLKERS